MPTSPPAGGFIAPMANSPPEIHTIARGDGAGAEAVLGKVGPKAAASAASVIGWPAPTLLAGERGHGRSTATATAAETTARAIKIHTERLSVEKVGVGRALVRFFRFMRALASRT